MSLTSSTKQKTNSFGEPLVNLRLRYTVQIKVGGHYQEVYHVARNDLSPLKAQIVEQEFYSILAKLEADNLLHSWTISIMPSLDYSLANRLLMKNVKLVTNQLANKTFDPS